MIYCYFTYKTDAALLDSSIKSVKQADPTAKIAVFDDAASPIETTLTVDYYKRTEFKRNGNLNGIDCVKGILSCFVEASEQLQDTVICKLDSDTYLANKPPVPAVFWGAELTSNLTAHGSCYVIQKDTVVSILADLNGRDWINGKWAEDQEISRRAVLKGGTIVPFTDKCIIQGNSWASAEQLKEWHAWTKLPNSVAIHFGTVITSTITKQHIANKMLEFLIDDAMLTSTSQV